MFGVKFCWNIDMVDGFFVIIFENIKKIIMVIWVCWFSIVFVNVLDDWYFDYGCVVKFIVDVCYYSGLVKIEISFFDGFLQEKWCFDVVYYYIQDCNLVVDFVVDIMFYMDCKMDIIMVYSF